MAPVVRVMAPYGCQPTPRSLVARRSRPRSLSDRGRALQSDRRTCLPSQPDCLPACLANCLPACTHACARARMPSGMNLCVGSRSHTPIHLRSDGHCARPHRDRTPHRGVIARSRRRAGRPTATADARPAVLPGHTRARDRAVRLRLRFVIAVIATIARDRDRMGRRSLRI